VRKRVCKLIACSVQKENCHKSRSREEKHAALSFYVCNFSRFTYRLRDERCFGRPCELWFDFQATTRDKPPSQQAMPVAKDRQGVKLSTRMIARTFFFFLEEVVNVRRLWRVIE
jgi:hypothetical protein